MTRTILIGLAAALVAAFAIELAVHVDHAGDLPPWHTIPGAFGIYSVVGCAALVAVAKLLGKLGLTRPELPDEPDAPRDPAAPEDAP